MIFETGVPFIYTLLKDEAYAKIIDMINKGELEYGVIYSLSWITEQLDMSRTPVRDAIHKLCDEHRLDVLPSRGFCLHKFDEEEYLQRYHFSSAIEGYCASFLAKHVKEEQYRETVEKLSRLQEKLIALYKENAPFSEFYSCDNEFHLQLIKSLGEAFYSKAVTVQGLYNMPELHLMNKPIDRKEIISCHEDILLAIKQGDPGKTYQAILNHSQLMYNSFKNS